MFLYVHKLVVYMHSSAADQLSLFIRNSEEHAVILLGVSGCGKSHAIYKNAMKKLCLYFTPSDRVTTSVVIQAQKESKNYNLEKAELYCKTMAPKLEKISHPIHYSPVSIELRVGV